MAADRSTYPPAYPWTHWGLQLERDFAARISHLSNGKNWPIADEFSDVQEQWENQYCIQSGQLRIIQHISFYAQGSYSKTVSMRERHDSEGENKTHLLWTCLANMALENCLPKLGHQLQQRLPPFFRLCMAKEPHSSPRELPPPSGDMQGEGLCLESNWGWDSLLDSICKLGIAMQWSALMVIKNHKKIVLGAQNRVHPQKTPFTSVQGTCLKTPTFTLVPSLHLQSSLALRASICEMGRETLLLSKAL